MPLVEITDIPSPKQLRGGWATLAAAHAAYGWTKFVYADENEWFYHDGCGNWACLRFKSKNQAILLGHDHEYSDTYFAKAAEYFKKDETNLLKNAPKWWGDNLSPPPFGEWIGFIYGWNGKIWQSADYDIEDGFESVGLLNAITQGYLSETIEFFLEEPDHEALAALIKADANFNAEKLKAVIPMDVEAGVLAAKRFLLAKI